MFGINALAKDRLIHSVYSLYAPCAQCRTRFVIQTRQPRDKLEMKAFSF